MFGQSTGYYDTEFESFNQGSLELPFAIGEVNDNSLAGLEIGDPYREMDDNTRGVSMAQPHGLDSSFWKAKMDDNNAGSFLNKEPRSTKDYNNSNLLLPQGGYDYSFFESDKLYLQPSSNFASGGILSPPVEQKFQSHHLPPQPVSSQHFFFAPSTLFLNQDCEPQQIGNCLLDFFRAQVVASVTKVRQEKYAIKAEVFVEGVSCMIKVKVYTHGDKYAVEVNRRAGDAFVHRSTYTSLSTFLKGRFDGVTAQDDKYEKALVLPPLVSFESFDLEEELVDDSSQAISQLLGMATIASMQAEAATALLQLTKGGRTSAAPLLAAPEEVASSLVQLLASGRMDTVYPAALCVSGLAALDEAGPLLAHQGLLQEVASQAVYELVAAQGLVGTALAQTVVDALQCCSSSLTPTIASDIREVLDAGLKNEQLTKNCDVVARNHLEHALFDTRLIV